MYRLSLHITSRQRDVLDRVAQGRTNGAIAHELGVSVSCVARRIATLKGRLGVLDRTSLVVAALQVGWLRLNEIVVDREE